MSIHNCLEIVDHVGNDWLATLDARRNAFSTQKVRLTSGEGRQLLRRIDRVAAVIGEHSSNQYRFAIHFRYLSV